MVSCLEKWLRGFSIPTEEMTNFLNRFPQAKFSGKIYRGLNFDHYPNFSEIYPQAICSWSSQKEIAEYFAGKYGIVLIKDSTGYEVDKILKVLDLENKLPESLKNYRHSSPEKEIIDSFDLGDVEIERTIKF